MFQGNLMDLHFLDYQCGQECHDRYIVVNPAVFAKMVCAVLVTDHHKSFRIEARRFWPKDHGVRRPDPSVLVQALEDIPKSGLVREVLFPLLWQVRVILISSLESPLKDVRRGILESLSVLSCMSRLHVSMPFEDHLIDFFEILFR